MSKTQSDHGNTAYLRSLLNFLAIAEKLKTELRHSWTSDISRQESVAEHTWMMSLLGIALMEKVKTPLDKLKCLKMIILHDLAEALVGDIPAFEKSKRKSTKHSDEVKAIRKIAKIVHDPKFASEIVSLWEEFEAGKTIEAQFAVAMDKVEVLIQHNIANISTWADGDYALNPYYKNDKFDFDNLLRKFKDMVDIDTMQKVESANMLGKIGKDHIGIWNSSKSQPRLK